MKVFISWSGNKSHKVALVFREWLPSVIQSIEPYVSSEDIDKGARWSSDIAKELENSSFGILCVTKDNLNAPWLSFEAGALSKTMDKSFVTPFLFDIKRSEVNGPILQFQSTIFEKDDIKKMIFTLNKACGENGITEAMLNRAFEVWYPTLKGELDKLIDFEDIPVEESIEEQNSSEIMEEILELSRDNQKLLRNPDTKINETIESLKDRIDLLCTKFEHSMELDERKMNRKNRIMIMDELMHTIPAECPKQYVFLIVLGMIQERFPWVYDIGKELLNILSTKSDTNVKIDAVRYFQHIMDISFGHLMTRGMNVRRKNEFIMIRDFEHMLIELSDAILEDVIKQTNE